MKMGITVTVIGFAALIAAANMKAMREARAMESAAAADAPAVKTPAPSAFPDEPQTVFFNILPTPTPRPVRMPAEELPEYKLNGNDVDRIAQLLWSSPCRTESEKAKLVWVVLNRIDAGAPFGTCVKEVVNSSEFTFFDRHARISDTNRRIVKGVMQRWMAEKDGHLIGRRPPKDALYVRFGGECNRKVTLTREAGGKAIEW